MIPPNDWEIKNCPCLALAVVLAIFGLVLLASLGFDIPVLRQIVGFIFLTFVPGILLLRILKIHNISAIESLVYSVGLSLAFVMFSGVLANFALPLVGVSRPISALPIMFTLVVFTLILAAIAYWRDRDFSAPKTDCFVTRAPGNDREKWKFLSPPFLLLLILPLLAILGAFVVNQYQNSLVLLFFIVVVCCVVALVAFDKLPREAYPLAIVTIGISLLLYVSLISTQLGGCDIHTEYYYQNLTTNSGYWNFAIPGNVNATLSITLLCPIYALLLDVSSIWVFKTVYPLIFCLVPLALFHVFRMQIGGKKAFFSAFFFMAVITFFAEMPFLARQEIAELFFALLIVLMVDRKLAPSQRLTLFIIFSLSLVVSHYALGYIYFAFLIGSWIVVVLIRSKARVIWEWLTKRSGGLPRDLISSRAFSNTSMAIIIGIYLVFTLAWYGVVAQGTALNTIRYIGQSQYSLLSLEVAQLAGPASTGPASTGPASTSKFFEPTERERLVVTALGLDFVDVSGLGKGFRVFQYLTELLIIIGCMRMIFKPKGFKFRTEYIALSAVAAVILFACIVIPRFSTYLNVSRFYHICLFLLAPMCILGGEVIWQKTSTLARSAFHRVKPEKEVALSADTNVGSSTYLQVLTLAILIPYFLFTSGFIFEIGGSQAYGINDTPSSIALSSYRLDMPVFDQKEAEAAQWLVTNVDGNTRVYGDFFGAFLLFERPFGQIGTIPAFEEVPDNAYIFLRTWNVKKQEIMVVSRSGVQWILNHVSLSHIPALLEDRQVIYDNGCARILAPRY